MIRLINGSVELVVDSEDKAEALRAKGFKAVEASEVKKSKKGKNLIDDPKGETPDILSEE